MDQEREELYSEKLCAGSRTYFFDMKESVDGTKYLTIRESRKGSGESYEGSWIMVFEEDLSGFCNSVRRSVEFAIGAQKTSYVEEMRRKHPKAYSNWTAEEDATLTSEHAQGKTIDQLAREFQRQPGAIRSRLRKLGLR